MVLRNRRGMVTFMLIFFVFFSVFVVIIAGTAFYGLETFDSVAGNITGITAGNISFETTYQESLGAGLRTVLSTLSTISIALIIGMIIVMMIVGFKLSNQNKLWIILDILIIVVAFIAAVYISQIFSSFINSDPIFLDIYSTDLQKSSTFILNLPFVIAIAGGLIMIITYIPLKRRSRSANVLEFN